MFVLGIDPGLTRCGYGVATKTLDAAVPFRAVAAGVIETPPTDPIDHRLGALSKEVDELLDEFAPGTVIVEKIFFQTNVKTAISVAQASGVVLAAAARRKIPVTQYTPNEVKHAMVGNGAASKLQVQEMVGRLCGITDALKPADVADALALALCHLSSSGLRAALAGARSS